ncbi:hypothetical protein M011DRAFT_404852 [Sporormia fimetaria CBS 119925]|uniref:ATP-dependent DNA helicase PIF1 n=1 Tax=Sporormia fimetaria CBS 119925 TaxID=1340428 RepID=A0A6A6V6U0_9PLEO|nr:hypothetical protein M011DRAFT_404852 [Sporormia fimetaria CBS 119925]
MLLALYRVSASLRLPSKASSSPKPSIRSPPRKYGYLATRPHSTTMFKQAVKNHKNPAASPTPSSQQQSLINSFKYNSTPVASSRPLSIGSENIRRDPKSTERRPTSSGYGVKRTSSGLAKALYVEEDFDYPALEFSPAGKANAARSSAGVATSGTATVYMDENKFEFNDSDFDDDDLLDIEDLAEKEVVKYPQLPKAPATPVPQTSTVVKSSQPVPWSSSPAEHFEPAPVPKLQPTKRRTLPWLQNGSRKTTADTGHHSSTAPLPRAEPFARNPSASAVSRASTNTDDSKYPWTTTASAVKQQQKNHREANKVAREGTDEDVQKAITARKKNQPHRVFLSDEQKHVLNLVTQHKKSVFFTGSAGTGKSVLLREIISTLRKKYIKEPDRIAVTASTGLAACNIGGVTLHSFSGIGLGKEPAEELVKKIRRNASARQRWLRARVLIIDEISMVDGELFDKLEQVARTLRNNGRPFGGIQLVITGDFFQLPPVAERGRVVKFAFDAGTWTTSIEHTIGLHHVFRQKDPVFAGMLNEMREGRLTPESIARFKSLDRPLPSSEIEATELFPTRAEVERANNIRMQQLHGDLFHFDARDGGTITDKTQRDKLLEKCLAPAVVSLKKGAQVMLIKNMDDTLVNGSLGKVTGFMTDQMFNIYKENEDAFLDGSLPPEADVRKQQAASLLGLNTQQVYPVVRFSVADGTTRDLLCKREAWKYELPNGEVQASREQIPLILAWAMSIHKAQGQTLERVRVDLGKAFEKGQSYVALSRATNMAGLQVLRFDPRKVQAHEKVRAFYSSLSRADHVSEQAQSKTILGKMQMQMQKGKGATDHERQSVGRETKRATDYERQFVGQ